MVRRLIEASERDDVDTLLARLGVDGPDAPLFIDDEDFFEVVEAITADGDNGLQFRYAASLDPDDYGTLGLAGKTAADLRGALDRVARYMLLLGDSAAYDVQPRSGGGITFSMIGRHPHRDGLRLANEAALAAILALCRKIAAPGTNPTPVSVSFRHRPPPSLDEHRAFFGCSLVYGAEADALQLDDAFLDTPARLADEALSAYVLGHLDDDLRNVELGRTLEADVRRVVANGLSEGVPSMREVAHRLDMSERTLHRRLAEDDLRYQDLVVDVRTKLSVALLTTTDTPLVDIAFLTGFSEQSAFQRAFKRWIGATPLSVRNG